MSFQLKLVYKNRGAWYQPSVCEGLTWETSRSGSPGVLTWDMYTNHVIDPGDEVRLTDFDTWKLFRGFVFTTQHGKDGKVKVTAYDQLRYLKNKDTYIYENWNAAQLIRKIASDYRLTCGDLADTGHVVKTYNGDNKTLFDIIGDALDAVLVEKNELYILWDDFGKLTLDNSHDLRIPILLTSGSAEDYDIQSSIDGETYNTIKLVYSDKQKSARVIYPEQDLNTINKWGVLQYYESVSSADGAAEKAKKLLKLYNTVQRSVTIKGIKGDNRMHGGCSLYVRMSMGEVMQDGWLIADKVTHKWTGNTHLMDLSLEGGVFNAS
ncbi:hydrolase [Caproicibacterium sp. XB1]|uniref:XkdQ/YqbQ family protein n=1 Tax=Caproicibacterium sp. XB1 TaxID=3396405 RepID=UPI0039B6FE0E